MFTRLIVGWNDTASAATWAAQGPSTVHVALVTEIPGHDGASDYLSAVPPGAQARVALMDAAERMRHDHPHIEISTQVVRGKVIEELIRLSPGRTLLVVGGTPSTGRHRPFGWSVDARLAAAPEPGAVAVIPLERRLSVQSKVVVGYDATSVSERVPDLAIAEAKSLYDSLEIVHAWTEPPEWQDEYMAELDEVVVGNHSDHGVRRLFLGSVSHAVVRALAAPTIVVRS